MRCYSRQIKTVLRRQVESGLAALIAVVDDAIWSSLRQRHVQRSNNEIGRHGLTN